MSKEITLNIESITILLDRFGMDLIQLELNHISPFPEMNYKGFATIQTRKDYGKQWLMEAFNLAPDKIIQINLAYAKTNNL